MLSFNRSSEEAKAITSLFAAITPADSILPNEPVEVIEPLTLPSKYAPASLVPLETYRANESSDL